MKTPDRAFYTILAIAMAVPLLLFVTAVIECQPMYAVNNSPPYGPPGGITEGGVALIGALLPGWLLIAYCAAAIGLVAGILACIYGFLRMLCGKSF